jgi:hypothetical protein
MKLEFLDFDSSEAKKKGMTAPESIETNVSITNAVLEKSILNLNFMYTVKYLPDGSYISISGNAKFSGEDAKAAYEEWKKKKTITGTNGEKIVNVVNYSAATNAVLIAKVFGFTPPISPPVIKFTK